MNIEEIMEDLQSSQLVFEYEESHGELVEGYDKVFQGIIDQLAPPFKKITMFRI